MRKIPTIGAVFAALAFAPAANAADPITQVFTGTSTPIACATQSGGAVDGQRWCGTQNGAGPTSTVPSFDGAPIDVTVTLPKAPVSGDGNFPVVGVFHGYGQFKDASSSPAVQRWAQQGYAVMTMTDRGFWGSCGRSVPAPKPASCAKGYIHLMDNAYEVRDAQTLLGQLADDGAIDPQKIGATGGSYGGGMSMQLGALKNRVVQTDGTLVPWTSPQGKPMRIAATAPLFGWSDLAQSLMPNGSGLDYAAYNPYTGPNGDRRFGIEKYVWNISLYGGGLQTGYYAPSHADPTANITAWLGVNNTGGPYDVDPVVQQQIEQLPRHGAYGTDDSVAPAPVLLENGWNDDLFPADEGLRYYNKIRANHPDTPISIFNLDLGHSNRSAGTGGGVAGFGELIQAQNAWFAHYVKGQGTAPADAVGGVTAVTSACPTGPAAQTFRARNWASLAPGEVRVDGAAAQTVAPDTKPVNPFSPEDPQVNPGSPAPTVCTDDDATDTPGAAVYRTPAAPAGGYTLLGAPTVVADLTVQNRNDAVYSRLYDVDPVTNRERLIARGTYRPTNPGGTSRQVFQLHPQAYKIAEGHQVKLELLGQDYPYAQRSTGQAPVGVQNLQLRIPTAEAPGAAAGQVQARAEKVLPAGYRLAADLPQPPPAGGETPSTPSTPAPVAPVPAGTVPPVAPTRPVVVPKPTDPVSRAAMLKALKKAPKKVTLSRSLRVFRFTDAFPQAGTVRYGLGVKVGKKVRVVGKVTRRVSKAGSIVVTIKTTAKGRATLKARRKATLVLAARFTTAIEKKQYVSARVLKRR
jgi:dienelactone hydrolase